MQSAPSVTNIVGMCSLMWLVRGTKATGVLRLCRGWRGLRHRALFLGWGGLSAGCASPGHTPQKYRAEMEEPPGLSRRLS